MDHLKELQKLQIIIHALSEADLPELDQVLLDAANDTLPQIIKEFKELRAIRDAAVKNYGYEAIYPNSKDKGVEL